MGNFKKTSRINKSVTKWFQALFQKDIERTLFQEFEGQGFFPEVHYMNPRSRFSVTPGDVLLFKYDDNLPRLMLVVRVRRGPGKFISTRKNLLISGFKLNPALATTPYIIREFYRKPIPSDYWDIKGFFGHLFGLENMRTYKLVEMKTIREVTING